MNQDIIQFIQVLDDDFLLSLANKGIFKRAKKDFDKLEGASLSSEEPLVVDLGDHQVTFNGSDAASIGCTCPDSRFCKHRMMAVWFLQSGDFFGGVAPHSSPAEAIEGSPASEEAGINIPADIAAFINTMDDDFILSLANKGIFKRAKKDFDKLEGVTLETEAPPVVDLGDHKVTFGGTEAAAIGCTCPDSRFCKHRMMAIWFLQSELAATKTEIPQEPVDPEAPFIPLLELDEAGLRKRFGKAAYEKGLRYFLKCNVTDHIQNGRLVFEIIPKHQSKGEKISFLPMDPLKNIICSCKKEKCFHQLSGLLHYLIKHRKLNREKLEQLIVDTLPTIDPDLLEEIEDVVYDIMNTGLSKITPLTLTRLNNLAYKAHYESSKLEKTLLQLKEILFRFLNKKGDFSIKLYSIRLMQPLRLIRIYRSNQNDPKIVTDLTKLRDDYIELSELQLFHIAKEYKASPGGSHMVSLYFMTKDGEVFQRTVFRTFYDGNHKNPKKTLLNSSIWGEVEDQQGSYPLDSFTLSKITLKNSKVSDSNRLSSRGDVIFKGHHDFYELPISDQFQTLKKEFIALRQKEALLSVNQRPFYAVIKPVEAAPIQFHLERQELTLQVFDQQGGSLTLRFFYKKEFKELFDHLQKLYAPDVENAIRPDLFFGRIGFDRETLFFYPISCYYEGLGVLKNIELEGFYSPVKKKKK